MPAELNVLFTTTLGQALIIVVVMLVERLAPLRPQYHPLFYFRAVANQLANKVRPGIQDSKQQHLISGALSYVVLVLPIAFAVGLLLDLAAVPAFFDVFILYLTLDFQRHVNSARFVAASVATDKKFLGRSRLSFDVCRDTDNLTQLGLLKACAETLCLRHFYQQIMVLFCYLTGGVLIALLYRLTYECAQVWNAKLPANRYFGKPVRQLVDLMCYVPARVISAFDFVTTKQQKAEQVPSFWYSGNGAILLFVWAKRLKLTLCGPRFYQGQRVDKPRYEQLHEVGPLSFAPINFRLTLHFFTVALCFILFGALTFSASVNAASFTTEAHTQPDQRSSEPNVNNQTRSKQEAHQSKRIIALAPHLTEWVFALGRESELIAVSEHSDYPPAAAELPQVASYRGIDLPQIIRLQPTHALVWGSGNRKQDMNRLSALGITLFISDPRSIDDFMEEFSRLGQLLHANEAAKHVLKPLQQQIAGSATATSKTLVYALNVVPFQAIAGDAWFTDMFSLCGWHNPLQDAEVTYGEFAVDAIIRRQPDILMVPKQQASAAKALVEKHKEFWAPRIFPVNDAVLNRYTPRAINYFFQLCEQR